MSIRDLRLDLTPTVKMLKTGARRDILSKTLEGTFVTPFKGKGMEFAGFRAYSYSDDASMIDWPASLRANEILVRDFEVYKNINIVFMLDVSDSMLFSSTKKNKLKAEYAAELVSALSYALVRTNNSIGLVMYSDKLNAKIYPDIGQGIVNKINHTLSNPNNYGGKFDFKRSIHLLRSFLGVNSLLFFVSDFIGMPDGWSRYISLLQSQYETVALVVRDPRDQELPKMSGQIMLQDPFSDETIQVDIRKFRKKYKEQAIKDISLIEKTFRRSHTLVLRTDEDYNNALIKFFKKRSTMYKL